MPSTNLSWQPFSTKEATCCNRERFRWPYYLGIVRGAEGKTSEAISILRKAAIMVDPDYLPARVRLAELLLATHNQEEAKTIFEQVLKQDPDCSQAHYGLGRIQSSTGQWQAAIQSYRRALTSSQGFGAAHYALATAYRQLGMLDEFQENIRLFQQNRGRSPQLDDPLLKTVAALRSHAEYYFKEGLRLQEEGRIEPAIVEYQRALKEDPEYGRAHANLCLAQLLMKRLDQAERHCQSALANLIRVFTKFATTWDCSAGFRVETKKLSKPFGKHWKSILFTPNPTIFWRRFWPRKGV